MVFRLPWDRGGEHLERVDGRVHEMLALDRHAFDLAMSSLLGEVDASEVKDEVRSTDQRVNQLEREIRRELVVNSDHFGGVDAPAVLLYMSIVKDVERVGDYAKNLLDLALEGADLSRTPDAAEWRQCAREASEIIPQAGEAFGARDAAKCRAVIRAGEERIGRFDAAVSALVRGEDAGAQAVARALAYRYLRRVVGHLMNLTGTVVLPLDRLHEMDEDRGPG